MAEMTERQRQVDAVPIRVASARSVSLLVIAILLFASGCSGFFVYPGSTGGGGGNTTGDYVYVANSSATSSNPSLAGFAVGTGTLTAVANSPYTLTVTPVALAVNPANSVLYVATNSGIYAYAIQSTGALSVLNSGSPVATALVASMDISPDGQWLLALDKTVSANGGAIDEYRINTSTGALTPQTFTYTISGTPNPLAIKISSNAQFVFAALGTAGELVLPFNTASGALTSYTQFAPPPGTSDSALAVDASAAYLYIARSGTNGGLAVYAIGSGGALAAVSGSPFAASKQPAVERSVVLNKAGTAVYIANASDGTISGFSIGTLGALTPLGGSPYTAGSQVTALSLDNSGNYLLSLAQGGSPDLALYSFDATTTGKLNLAASTATGTDPTLAVAIAATH